VTVLLTFCCDFIVQNDAELPAPCDDSCEGAQLASQNP